MFSLGDRIVKRLGYGAMQLAGPGVFGPPKDYNAAFGVLREAAASGVNHIDTRPLCATKCIDGAFMKKNAAWSN